MIELRRCAVANTRRVDGGADGVKAETVWAAGARARVRKARLSGLPETGRRAVRQCICEGGMVSWHRRENKKRKYLVQCVRQRMRWPGGETWDDERAGELRRCDGGEGTRVANGWQQPPWVSDGTRPAHPRGRATCSVATGPYIACKVGWQDLSSSQ
jgi:hypothetical protein